MQAKLIYTLVFLLAALQFSLSAAEATRLPGDTRKQALSTFSNGTVRLDGSISMPDGSILLPLMPSSASTKIKMDLTRFPADAKEPLVVFYSNHWGHLRASRRGDVLTVMLPAEMPDPVRRKLIASKFPSDLIVPEGLVLPRSLKPLVGDLAISVMDDTQIAKPDFGVRRQSDGSQAYTGPGIFALASLSAGTICLIDGKTFNRIAEFPTEGTPCALDFVQGKLYAVDQAKHRILVIDPLSRKFLGQIELSAKTAPKGIAALPSGKLIYVSESASSNIAVIEKETGKILMRTKVATGPGKMAMTEDGIYLVALSVTAGEVSLLSTYNQRVIGTVKVGSVPTAVVVSGGKERIAYVSNRNSNSVSVIDLSKRVVISTLKTGNGPTGLALSPGGDKLYVACGRDNVVMVFDTKSFSRLSEVKLPLDVDFPGQICLSQDAKYLLVTSQQTDTIGIMDTEKGEFVKQIKLSHPMHEACWGPVGPKTAPVGVKN